jgi:hypothetical protein
VSQNKAKFIQSEKVFHVQNGQIIEGATLTLGVTAKINAADDNFEALNIQETVDTVQYTGNDPMTNGWMWYADGYAETSPNVGGSGNWGIYYQSNISTTARRFAGKSSAYGLHIYRAPNIPDTSTWGGIVYYPGSQAKQIGRKYRLSFDYRGYSGGYWLDIYQNYTVGWGDLGIGLPTPWGASIAPFDTDWQWRRFEYEFTVSADYVNFVPGSNRPVWDPGTQYGDWQPVQYEGYVYRKPSWTGQPTRGVPPDQEYPAIWDYRAPMTAGYFDLYSQIKIGFNYQTQDARGTHVFFDNIQLEDITDNSGFKYNNTTFEANNFREGLNYIKAVGTAYPVIGNPDQFRVEGSQSLTVNGTQVYSSTNRGLRLTVFNEATLLTNQTPLIDQSYDVYAIDTDRTDLATTLSTITDDKVWVLTSFDAINPNAILDTQMKKMGSSLLVNDNNLWSVYRGGGVRHPYAAVGRGQKIIKEDGANGSDSKYKRKGVIDLWI